MTAFRAACVQLRSSDDVAENIRIASALIREAKAQGADFIATPENTTLMAPISRACSWSMGTGVRGS